MKDITVIFVASGGMVKADSEVQDYVKWYISDEAQVSGSCLKVK
jgi:hypothetical protein